MSVPTLLQSHETNAARHRELEQRVNVMEQQLSVKEANLGMKEQQLFLKNQEIISLRNELQIQLGTITSLMSELEILRAHLAEKKVI
jgi:nitrogenase molybdenum-iron protein alpha/beta subunit